MGLLNHERSCIASTILLARQDLFVIMVAMKMPTGAKALLGDYWRKNGKKGGKARAESLTAARRKEIASQGGKARAAKYRKAAVALLLLCLHIGTV